MHIISFRSNTARFNRSKIAAESLPCLAKRWGKTGRMGDGGRRGEWELAGEELSPRWIERLCWRRRMASPKWGWQPDNCAGSQPTDDRPALERSWFETTTEADSILETIVGDWMSLEIVAKGQTREGDRDTETEKKGEAESFQSERHSSTNVAAWLSIFVFWYNDRIALIE